VADGPCRVPSLRVAHIEPWQVGSAQWRHCVWCSSNYCCSGVSASVATSWALVLRCRGGKCTGQRSASCVRSSSQVGPLPLGCLQLAACSAGDYEEQVYMRERVLHSQRVTLRCDYSVVTIGCDHLFRIIFFVARDGCIYLHATARRPWPACVLIINMPAFHARFADNTSCPSTRDAADQTLSRNAVSQAHCNAQSVLHWS
jgi:hypothetical protein